MAKAPVPGRVKTRLCPPLSPEEAAEVAAAALADTLEAVAACAAPRKVIALAGDPGPWLPSGFQIVPQRGAGLDERLTAAWADTGGPGLQIGMDTPQVTAALLDDGLARLDHTDAALGFALDGGWWGIALRRPHARAFAGVPMSTHHTGARQLERLRSLNLDVALLPVLQDIDDPDDVAEVAATIPTSRTAAVAERVGLDVVGAA